MFFFNEILQNASTSDSKVIDVLENVGKVFSPVMRGPWSLREHGFGHGKGRGNSMPTNSAGNSDDTYSPSKCYYSLSKCWTLAVPFLTQVSCHPQSVVIARGPFLFPAVLLEEILLHLAFDDG